MFGRKRAERQSNSTPEGSTGQQSSPIPDGCHGCVSAETRETDLPQGAHPVTEIYSTTTAIKFACSGLLDGVVTVHEAQTTWGGKTYSDVNSGRWAPSNEHVAELRRKRMEEANVYIAAICATCPRGSLNLQRQEAELRVAARDELEIKLRIAEAERDALALRAQLGLGTVASQLALETGPEPIS